MKFVWNIRGRFSWLVVLGTVTLLVCGPLSLLPAIYFSERTPDARVAFEYPDGHPVWVAPWLYHFSSVMHYLAIAGIVAFVIGVVLSSLRTRRHENAAS